MVVPLHAYIKSASIVIFCLIILAGCATAPVSRPETDTSGAAATTEDKVSPEVRQAFEQAVVILRNKDYKNAIRAFKGVSRMAPKLAAPHINQAIAYRHLGELSKAEKAISEALKRDGKSPEALNMLGLINRSNGEFMAARKNYEKAISIQPDYAEAHLNLAMLCDIYLVDWPCAKRHYGRFQAVSGQPDKQVKGWVADLDRRMKKAGR